MSSGFVHHLAIYRDPDGLSVSPGALHSHSVMHRNSGGHTGEKVPSSMQEQVQQPWKLPALHWLHWIIPNPSDSLGWCLLMVGPAKSYTKSLCQGRFGSLGKQSHSSSDIMRSKAVLQTVFSSVYLMLTLVPGIHLSHSEWSQLLGSLLQCSSLLFAMNLLHYWFSCWLTVVSFAEHGKKYLEITLSMT